MVTCVLRCVCSDPESFPAPPLNCQWLEAFDFYVGYCSQWSRGYYVKGLDHEYFIVTKVLFSVEDVEVCETRFFSLILFVCVTIMVV